MQTHELIKKLDEYDRNMNRDAITALESKIIDVAIQEKTPVEIYYNDEAGRFQYSVQIVGTDFWLEAFVTEEEAIEFCREEGLPLTRRSK